MNADGEKKKKIRQWVVVAWKLNKNKWKKKTNDFFSAWNCYWWNKLKSEKKLFVCLFSLLCNSFLDFIWLFYFFFFGIVNLENLLSMFVAFIVIRAYVFHFHHIFPHFILYFSFFIFFFICKSTKPLYN